MRRVFLSPAMVLLLFLPARSEEELSMNAVLRGIESRPIAEPTGKGMPPNRAWSKSEAGRRELKWLAARYGEIPADKRGRVSSSIARTGAVEAIPFIRAALEDPQNRAVIPALHGADRSEPEFGVEAAKLLLPRFEITMSGRYRAVGLLPGLDPELAKKTLLTDTWLTSPDRCWEVLEAFNHADVTIPKEVLHEIVRSSREPAFAANPSRDHRKRYEEALQAWARHDPADAAARADEWIERTPSPELDLGEVYLQAAGLRNIWDVPAIDAHSPSFRKLPEPMRLFLATTYVCNDRANGSIFQVFGNHTGALLPLALKGHLASGDTANATNLAAILAEFGKGGPPANRAFREFLVEHMNNERIARIEKLDDQWLEILRSGTNLDPHLHMCRYAAKHADEIRPHLRKNPSPGK